MIGKSLSIIESLVQDLLDTMSPQELMLNVRVLDFANHLGLTRRMK